MRQVEAMREEGFEPDAEMLVAYNAVIKSVLARRRGLDAANAANAATRVAAGVKHTVADAIALVLASSNGTPMSSSQLRQQIIEGRDLATVDRPCTVSDTLKKHENERFRRAFKKGQEWFWELIARDAPHDASATDTRASAPVAPPGVAAAAAVRDPGAARTDAVARVATGGAFAASYAKVVRDDPPAAASVRAAVRVSAVAAAPSGAARSSGASASASAGGRSHSAVVKRAGGRGARQLGKPIEAMTVKELQAALECREVQFSKKNDKLKQLQEMLREAVKQERGGNAFFNFFKKG